jgi:DNA polymerase-3 subunit delta'
LLGDPAADTVMQLTGLPQISSPLPWHAHDWAQLTGQLAEDKLPHALLLMGEQYTGKSQFALALSRLLLCAHPEGGLNCGSCHACELSRSGSHGDFNWVQPGEKSRTIKIDQIREVVQFTSKTAGFGKRKVVVLAPADSMNINAFNALLKSLEEPSSETYLILVCHRMHTVPATIRSRCQCRRLAIPDAQSSLHWLDTFTAERLESETILSLAGGRPLLAEQLICSGDTHDLAVRRAALGELLQGRLDLPQAVGLWRDVEPDEFLEQITLEIQHRLRTLSQVQLKSQQSRAAYGLLDELAQLQRAVSAGANPSKQLVVEAILSKFHRMLGAGPLGDNIGVRTEGIDA